MFPGQTAPRALFLVSVKKLIKNTISNLTVFEIAPFFSEFFGDTSEPIKSMSG